MTIDWSGLAAWTNDIYKSLYRNWCRFLIVYGGSGSGKSFFIAQRYIFRVLTVPGYNLLTLRKYGVTNRFSTFALLQQVISQWGLESFFVINKTDMTITAIPTKNQILFLGLDSTEKIKSLTFISGILSAVWMEEANEFTFDDFSQINLRLRGQAPIPLQITVSFNPVSAFHWLKEYFFDNQPDDCTILKTTYLDNRFIDEAYKKQLDNLKGSYRQVYALGEWGVTDGLVFKSFGIKEVPAGVKLSGYGMDFGFSSDPCTLIGVYVNGEDLYLDEKIYQTGLTNSDLSRKMKSLEIRPTVKIVADSAEPKSIEELHRAGWNIHPAKKGPDSIRYGLDLMMAKNIFITPESKNLQKEFYSYSWKKDKNGKFLPDPEDDFNHGIDAIRYYCMSLSKKSPTAGPSI